MTAAGEYVRGVKVGLSVSPCCCFHFIANVAHAKTKNRPR